VTTTELAIVLGMAVAVFLPKAVPLVAISEHHVARLQRWLQYVAPAVLGALVAPSIAVNPNWSQAAYLVAFVIAVRTRRMLPSIAAGLAALVLVTLIHL
jgi:branched-subunit amino acid transport protein